MAMLNKRWLAGALTLLLAGYQPMEDRDRNANALDLPAPWHWQCITGQGFGYDVKKSISLAQLAETYHVSSTHLAQGNHWPVEKPLPVGSRVWLSDQRIQPGRPGSGVLVNLPERRLDLVLDGRWVASWPVSIGAAAWPTPLGHYELGSPRYQPTWIVPASILAEAAAQGHPLPRVVPPGPKNPLGAVWLAIGDTGVGIHATNTTVSPWTAERASHGCLRMTTIDAMAFARRWRPGLQIDIVYQRAKTVTVAGERYLEVHPDPYGSQPHPTGSLADDSLAVRIWQMACGWPLRWSQVTE